MRRWLSQLIASIAVNSNVQGFLEGKIYKGPIKNACVPGLNCYSCPGAIGSCPIGSLQAVIGSAKYHFSFYIIGFLSLIGALFGRWICGWICPFGFFQDLLAKVTEKKWHLPRWTTYIKYLLLIVFVILLPMLVTNIVGMGNPTYCKYICPNGTLIGAIPLLSLNVGLRQALGWLFTWKVGVLIVVVLLSVKIHRFFCKVMCPLGAFYALFNRFSFYQLKVDTDKCVSCGKCEKACPMDVSVEKIGIDPECIRCKECISACPIGAIRKEKVTLRKDKNVECVDAFKIVR